MNWFRKLSIGREAALPALLAVLLAISIVASSTVFAQGDQTQRALAYAADAHAAEQLLTATTAARASTAVALLVADAAEANRATAEERRAALDDLEGIRSQLVERAAALGASLDAPSILSGVDAASAILTQMTGLISAGDLDAAEILTQQALIPAISLVEAETLEMRDQALTRVAAEAGTAGALARAASIAVALIVPIMALIAFRWMQRRRQEQRELQLELEHQLERSRTKDEMIANLSHELRTPLTGIYGLALTLADEGFSDAELSRELIEIIVREAADLSRMVDDLLTAAKVDAGDIAMVSESIDPAALVEEVAAPYARSRHITLNCEPAELQADSLRVKQVIRNILSNAVKHGGPRIGIVGQQRDDRYVFVVLDDGPGVPAELEHRIFDRFIHDGSTPLTQGSVGLGLSIASQLMKRMGGSLSYRRVNDSTTFLIDLPVAPVQGIPEPPLVAPLTSPPL